MSPKQERKGDTRKWIFGRGIWIGTSFLAILLGSIIAALGWQSGHNIGVSPTSTTNSPISTTTPVITASGNSIGSPQAPITIVEYSDFQCAHCQQFALTIEPQIYTNYIQTGKVRLVFKHLIAFGEESLLAAVASECAAAQNLFWLYHRELMELKLSPDNKDLNEEQLNEIAQQVGLNMTLFNEDMASGKYLAKVLQDDTEGRGLGLKVIPSLFLNGVKIEDKKISSFENIQKVLDEALAELEK